MLSRRQGFDLRRLEQARFSTAFGDADQRRQFIRVTLMLTGEDDAVSCVPRQMPDAEPFERALKLDQRGDVARRKVDHREIRRDIVAIEDLAPAIRQGL